MPRGEGTRDPAAEIPLSVYHRSYQVVKHFLVIYYCITKCYIKSPIIYHSFFMDIIGILSTRKAGIP